MKIVGSDDLDGWILSMIDSSCAKLVASLKPTLTDLSPSQVNVLREWLLSVPIHQGKTWSSVHLLMDQQGTYYALSYELTELIQAPSSIPT